MTMTPLFVAISFVAGALATLAIFQLVRPVLAGRMVWPALAAAALTTLVTSLFGILTGAAHLHYLLALCAFTLPVLVLLEAAAINFGAGRLARWVLMLLWGAVVFPGATLIPLIVTAPCRYGGCTLVDFGGALPLFVSAAAFVVLARSRTVTPEPAPSVGRGRATIGILGFWVAFVIWLVSLEASLDEFTLRIMLAAVIGPVSGAWGWALVDTLKATGRPLVRSLGFGFLAGIAATVSGAVAVSFPWSAVVGVLAGIAGALIHASKSLQRGGLAPRWGLTLLGATAIGFLAPAVWGDTIGLLFNAQVGAIVTPLVAFLGVAIGSVIVSAPAWLLVRRSRVTV